MIWAINVNIGRIVVIHNINYFWVFLATNKKWIVKKLRLKITKTCQTHITATANQKLADTNFSSHVDPTMPFPLLVEGVNVPLFDNQYIDCSLAS